MGSLKSRLIVPCLSMLLTAISTSLIAAPGDIPTPAEAPGAATSISGGILIAAVGAPAAAVPVTPPPIQPAAAAAIPAAAIPTEQTETAPAPVDTQSPTEPQTQPDLPAPTSTPEPEQMQAAEAPAAMDGTTDADGQTMSDEPAMAKPAGPTTDLDSESSEKMAAQEPVQKQQVPAQEPPQAQQTQEQPTPEQQASAFIPEGQASDVRVIIDISGSMKQNDSNNLRIPALNLIVEMLPEGSQAGVWTFGQWVNMLIPPAEVNQAWRDNAKEKAKKINSHGLRTNIGEAMEKALWKMSKDSGYAQSVILLTDGLVDITDDQDPQKSEKDEAERQRILSDILKRYKDAGTKIHTIALSENADKPLLDRLSLETGGMAEVVRTSEELVKAFVKTFDQAAPEVAEQVPLSKDNTFNIDNSVQEFTALMFRKAGTPAAQLKDPSGNVISQIKAIPNARWFGESVYDLVTVEQPEPGEWQILADLDPDNRVTVVSDLKMEIENLPTNLFPGQQIDFEVYLHEDGKIIDRKEFLQLMTVEMKMTTQSGRSGTKVISDPENIPADGRYKESIKRLSKEGEYELQIRVDGKTFQRLRKTYLQVRQPVGFEIRKRRVDNKMGYAVHVVPQSPAVKVGDTRVIAKIKGPDKHSIIQSMPWVEEGVWETVVTDSKGPGVYKISMNIKGTLGENQEFRVKPTPIELTFPVPADFTHEYFVKEESVEIEPPVEETPAEPPMPDLAEKMKEAPAEEPQEQMEEKSEEQPEEQEKPEEEPNPDAESETSEEASEEASEEEMEESSGLPMWLLILIPALTVFAGLGGFLAYRAMQKKKSAQSDLNDMADSSGSGPDDASGGDDMPDDVSLNDGLDDDNFDEDFDLSDDDEDEDIAIESNDEDDLSDLDLGDDEEPDDAEPESAEAPAAEEAESQDDEIPDFDEDFDLGGDEEAETEAPAAEPPATEPESDAVDDLEEVLDSALGDEEAPAAESEAADEADVPTLDAEAEPAETESESEETPEPPKLDNAGDENIDEALANLENELDDIDIEGLMDDDEK